MVPISPCKGEEFIFVISYFLLRGILLGLCNVSTHFLLLVANYKLGLPLIVVIITFEKIYF